MVPNTVRGNHSSLSLASGNLLALMTSHSLLLSLWHVLFSLSVTWHFVSVYLSVLFVLCCGSYYFFWGGGEGRLMCVYVCVHVHTHRAVVKEHGQSSLYWYKWTAVPQQLMRAEEMQSNECPAMCWKGRRLHLRGERALRQRVAEAGRGRGKICTSGETPEASGSHAYFFFFFNLLERRGPILEVFRVWMNQNINIFYV